MAEVEHPIAETIADINARLMALELLVVVDLAARLKTAEDPVATVRDLREKILPSADEHAATHEFDQVYANLARMLDTLEKSVAP